MSAAILVALGLAGALGAVSRFLLTMACGNWFGLASPWAILLVNLAGCLLFGLAWGALEYRASPLLTAAVFSGFLGAFTTFSTFAGDTVMMLERGQWLQAAANVAAHNLLGIAALAAGLALGRALA